MGAGIGADTGAGPGFPTGGEEPATLTDHQLFQVGRVGVTGAGTGAGVGGGTGALVGDGTGALVGGGTGAIVGG